MGPYSESTEYTFNADELKSAFQLQWGRTLRARNTIIRNVLFDLMPLASMGPYSESTEYLRQRVRFSVATNASMGPYSESTEYNHHLGRGAVVKLLQWGRTLRARNTILRCLDLRIQIWLQWGRTLRARNTGARPTASRATPGFNGAVL